MLYSSYRKISPARVLDWYMIILTKSGTISDFVCSLFLPLIVRTKSTCNRFCEKKKITSSLCTSNSRWRIFECIAHRCKENGRTLIHWTRSLFVFGLQDGLKGWNRILKKDLDQRCHPSIDWYYRCALCWCCRLHRHFRFLPSRSQCVQQSHWTLESRLALSRWVPWTQFPPEQKPSWACQS